MAGAALCTSEEPLLCRATTVIAWGRYADLMDFNAKTNRVLVPETELWETPKAYGAFENFSPGSPLERSRLKRYSSSCLRNGAWRGPLKPRAGRLGSSKADGPRVTSAMTARLSRIAFGHAEDAFARARVSVDVTVNDALEDGRMTFDAGDQVFLGVVRVVGALPVRGAFPARDVDEGESLIAHPGVFVQVRLDKARSF